jgi:hypothetical protein
MIAPASSWMYRMARHSTPIGTFMRWWRAAATPVGGTARPVSTAGRTSTSRPAVRRAAGTAWPVLVAGVMAAGCGSTPAAGLEPATPPAPAPLATSFADSTGSAWAVVEMGGSAAQENNFWELFVRPSAAAHWRLATPSGVADNGGLEVAQAGGGSLVTGFRPSQDLTFSPLAATSDDGTTWSASGPVSPGLADAPDALAAGPGGRLIALTGNGEAELGTGLGAAWTRLSSARSLAATPAGRACGLTGLTAAAFGSSGAPTLGASCDRPGFAGIFSDSGGAWHAAGPAVPAALAREQIDVLTLTSDGAAPGAGVVALLRAGSGADATLTAAWSADGGSRWTVSAPLRLGGGQLVSAAVGPGGSFGIVLNESRGAILTGPGASWRALPALPRETATLALGASGQADAIAAHLRSFTDWRLGASGWTLAQTINVTIPYGSSG